MELKKIVQIKSGKRMPKGTFLTSVKNSHPYIKVKDMGEYKTKLNNSFEYVPDDIFPNINKYIVQTNDIILSIVGTIGNVSIVDESLNNASLTENCVKLIPNEKLLNEYLYYFLISPKGKMEIEKGIIGSTQPKLPFYNIELIDIPLIDIPNQQHIVNIIGSIDDLIEKYNTINDKISNISQLIVMKSLSSECKDRKVIDIATVNSGKTTKKLKDGKFEIIGANGCLGYTDNYNLSTNAIITGRVGTIGTFKQISEPVWCSDNTLIIKTMYFNFLFYYLKQYFDCNSLNRGSTQPLITQTDLLDYKIKIPSNIDILEKKLNEYYLLIKKNNDEINKLNILKQQYLKKFFG